MRSGTWLLDVRNPFGRAQGFRVQPHRDGSEGRPLACRSRRRRGEGGTGATWRSHARSRRFRRGFLCRLQPQQAQPCPRSQTSRGPGRHAPPGRPLRAGASIIDILGAVFGVVALQAALRELATTGQGQRVSSALFESAAFLMASHMAGMAATGLPAQPMPARRGAWAIYEVFAVADGELFIGVTSDQQWTRFVAEFGLHDLAADPRLATNLMRSQQRSWLIPALGDVLAKLPQAEVARRCERANS